MRQINIINTQGQTLVTKEVIQASDIAKAFKECWSDGLTFKHVDIPKTLSDFNNEYKCQVRSILYVEDEELLGLTTKKFAEKLGHCYHSVLSAEEAIEIVSKQPSLFNVVFVDKNLPGLNGEEFAIKLKSFNPHIRIFIVTGDPDSVDKESVVKYVERIIAKPFRFEHLKNIVGTFDGSDTKDVA
jgi:CheY-like chemotaxis protein